MLKFNKKKLKNVEAKYICPKCEFVYDDDAYQVECGCIVCAACLYKIRDNSKCVLCDELISDKFQMLDRALLRQLNKIEFVCTDCTFTGNLAALKVHYESTHMDLTLCQFCKQKLNDQEQHLCPLEQLACSYSNIGCTATFPRKDMPNHMNLIENHVQLLKDFVIEKFKISNESEPHTGTASASEDVEMIDLQKGSPRGKLKDERLVVLEKNLTKLSEDVSKYVLTQEKLKRESDEMRQEYKQSVEAIDNKVRLFQSTVVNCDERISNLDVRSYDGRLIWKIISVAEKRKDAIENRQTSFYSPIFYSSRYGYRMCARVYLNGDGMGRGTHLSLFFVILRGEYDALLKWPFQSKVSFILLDQSDKRQHVMDTFRPDPSSNSFKRPTTDMNIASGIPLFCSLSKTFSNENAFVKDNIMFIQVQVDTSDLLTPGFQ